jgi:hypothetical protein
MLSPVVKNVSHEMPAGSSIHDFRPSITTSGLAFFTCRRRFAKPTIDFLQLALLDLDAKVVEAGFATARRITVFMDHEHIHFA